MNKIEDRQLTPKERVEISKRRSDLDAQKKNHVEETLDDLKKELEIDNKRNKR